MTETVTLPLDSVERLLLMAMIWSESKDFIEPEPEDIEAIKLVDRAIQQVREMPSGA